MNDLRVLIAAENASTRFGGEAILPYHYFRLLRARDIDAHLVTHARTRDELQGLFPDDLERLHFVPDLALQKLLFRVGKLLPTRIADNTSGLLNQVLTQHAQRRVLRGLVTHRTVVHQPTPVSPRFPSLLYGLGAPVVIGPLNGGMDYPAAFGHAQSVTTEAVVAAGRALTGLANALWPGKQQAAIVLVANRRTRAALPVRLRGRILELPENAVDVSRWTNSQAGPPVHAKRFVFIGRLVDWKALDLAMEALAKVPEASLEVVGDGPMLNTWRDGAARLGLADRVHFHGWLSQAECADLLASSCALVLPSLLECGGAVVLEAMSMSRAVIATGWGGPADYLDPSCGFLVAPTSRDAVISGFSTAMRTLIDSPALALELGTRGRKKLLRDYDWQGKIDRMLLLYEQAIEMGSQ